MLKDPQTQRYAQRRTHRIYASQFKAELVAMCHKPGASIVAVALQHGRNANLLHRWRKKWAQGLHRQEGSVTTAVATPQTPAFIPVSTDKLLAFVLGPIGGCKSPSISVS